MARQCSLAPPGALWRLWLAAVFFSVSASWRVVALDEPVANSCSDSSYSWSYNSQGQSPCEVTAQVLDACPVGKDGGRNDCYCNPVTYSLWAACSLCNGEQPHDFSTYSDDGQCVELADSLPSNGVNIPGWASVPLVNGDTFNESAAKNEAGGGQSSESASTDNNAAPPSTPSPPSQSSKTPDSSSTNAGDAQSQSDPVPQSSSPSSPAGVPGQQTSSLPNDAVHTGSSASRAATAGGSSGLLPVTLAASGQPSSQSTTAYVSVTSQSSQLVSSSLNTDGYAQPSASLPPTSDSMRSARGNSNHMGAIIAGAVGGVVLLLIAAFVTLCVVRRRRRRRYAKEALIASGPLEWWMRPGGAPIWHPDPEQSECGTIRPESEDGESEVTTLPGDDVSEKKSVQYGNYPDI